MAINLSQEFKNMARASIDGTETTICIRHITAANWSWIAIRYPLDPRKTETEILFDFAGMKWPEIIDTMKDYLAGNPATGFQM